MSHQKFDVVVIGAGAAGMLAAIAAHDAGLRSAVFEKAARYGGTSAVSGGGLWIPNNPDIAGRDSVEQAEAYLRACVPGGVPDRLAAFVKDAVRMLVYLRERAGVPMRSIEAFPDYFSRLPGAICGRVMAPDDLDAGRLGVDQHDIRDVFPYLKLFGSISLSTTDALALHSKAPGWQLTLLRRLLKYWLDVPGRMRSRQDRTLSNGQALVGYLRLAMKERSIPLYLQSPLQSLGQATGRVDSIFIGSGARASRIEAVHAVILTAGGFESNQAWRSHYATKPLSARNSAPPAGMNTGDAISAALELGAAVESMAFAWKAPVMRIPAQGANDEQVIPLFWERAAPGSLCINARGRRFTNEALAYDAFAAAMLANAESCGEHGWLVFDADCRGRSRVGPLMPGKLAPDSRLPRGWIDTVVYRADTIAELARKIEVDPAALSQAIVQFNMQAETGHDAEFDRGGSAYDSFWGDPAVGGNGTLAPLRRPPFYALRMEPGDLGTKGGLVTDGFGRVLREGGSPITGLYAAGNTAASIFGDSYPGPGATLAPALTQAFVAVEHISGAREERA